MSRILPKLSKLFFNFGLVSVLLFTSLSPVLAYTAPVPEIPRPDEDGKITIPAAKAGEGTLQGFQMSLALSEYNKESFDLQSLSGVMFGLSSMLLGCYIDNDGDQKVDSSACPKSLTTGAIPAVGKMTAGLISSPPVSSIDYLADVGEKLNLIKPAYAQTGYGFTAINPFLTAWRATRNLTYLLFVLVAIGFGIAIMLRTKISPQAVITIQSSLPKIVVALIFVTFSYAIVGLIVDLVYVVFGLLVWGLSTSGLTIIDPSKTFNDYSSSNFGRVVGFIWTKGLSGATDIFSGIDLGLPGPIEQLIEGLLGVLAGAAAILGIGLGTLPLLLGMLLALLFFFIRVLFVIAKAYLLLLIHLVAAPLFILWSVTIGGGIWSGWLKGVVSNAMVFPAVGIILLITDVLIRLIDQPGTTLWAPPYVGNEKNLIKGMIALGAVMLLPTIPDIINQMLGIRGGLPVQLPQFGKSVQDALQNVSRALSKPVGSKCMPLGTLINTPKGETFIHNLIKSDHIWTVNLAGEKVLAVIEEVFRNPVPQTHKMLRISLADGRTTTASPLHPDLNGKSFSEFKAGDLFDNSSVSKIELTEYKEGFIYDILPSGETGAYWANGVLVGSTLFHPKIISFQAA